MKDLERIFVERLKMLYGAERAPSILSRLLEIIHRFQSDSPTSQTRTTDKWLSEGDTVLITYGDMVKEENMEINRCFEILEFDRNASLEEARKEM